MAYVQTHVHGGRRVPLSRVGAGIDLTHVFVSAVHISDDGTIVLNDHAHDDPFHDQMWRDLDGVRSRGVRVAAMVGGWAPGTMCKLDGDDFERYYPHLRDFLRRRRFQGIDIDVEQPMSLDGVVRLIDAVADDFGDEFEIALAPVASALWGGPHLSGFDHRALGRLRGDRIDFCTLQFYEGWGSLATPDDYERAVAESGWPVHKLVAGMSGNPLDARGFVGMDVVAETIATLCERHPDFGGVNVWEWFRVLPGGEDDPGAWVDLMTTAMRRATG